MIYSRAALRKDQQQRQHAAECPPKSPLDLVPVDAPVEDPDAVMHVWGGEHWVPYEKWLATAPVLVDETPQEKPPYPLDADVITGVCGQTRVSLAQDGERWLMYVGSVRPANRKKDFASPFIGHAIRTAEEWYGAPTDGWRAEKGKDAKRRKGADLHPQDSAHQEPA